MTMTACMSNFLEKRKIPQAMLAVQAGKKVRKPLYMTNHSHRNQKHRLWGRRSPLFKIWMSRHQQHQLGGQRRPLLKMRVNRHHQKHRRR